MSYLKNPKAKNLNKCNQQQCILMYIAVHFIRSSTVYDKTKKRNLLQNEMKSSLTKFSFLNILFSRS